MTVTSSTNTDAMVNLLAGPYRAELQRTPSVCRRDQRARSLSQPECGKGGTFGYCSNACEASTSADH